MMKLLRFCLPLALVLALLLCTVSCANADADAPAEEGIYTLSAVRDVKVLDGFDGTLADFAVLYRDSAVEFRASEGMIQWRGEDETKWHDLVMRETLLGLGENAAGQSALQSTGYVKGAPSLMADAGTADEEGKQEEEKEPVAEGTLYKVGNIRYINFGKYPQTHIGDETLVAALNALATPNALGYYEYEGKEYAKVTATPHKSGTYTDADGKEQTYTYSDGTAVTSGAVEWFLVEPIVWRVLASKNGQYQLLAESLLDISAYSEDTAIQEGEGGVRIAPNNYAASDLRSFLNGTFLNRAFPDGRQTAISTVTVENGVSSTGYYDKNLYACEDTTDKTYSLGYREVFDRTFFSGNAARAAKATDYAVAVGAFTSSADGYAASWWVRTPYCHGGDFAYFVDANGFYNYFSLATAGGRCVRPTLWLSLEA